MTRFAMVVLALGASRWQVVPAPGPIAAGVSARQVQPGPPAPPAAKAAPFAWYTQFGDEILNSVDVALVGKVAAVVQVQGTDVVRVEIVEWLQGERPKKVVASDDLTLLAQRDELFVGNEQLLFLKLYEKGPRYTIFNRIARTDPDWEPKRRCLDQNLALRALAKDEERRRAARKLLYDDLAAREPWSRWHSFHELEYVRKKYPGLITRDDREEMLKVVDRCDDAALKRAMLKLFEEWDK